MCVKINHSSLTAHEQRDGCDDCRSREQSEVTDIPLLSLFFKGEGQQGLSEIIDLV